MNEDGSNCNFLKDPIAIGDLLGDGASFEINPDFDEGFITEIDDETLGSEDEDIEADRSLLISPWTKPFAELKTLMEKINDHIYKRVMVHGYAEKGTPNISRVLIRYHAFWEGETAPFDSSYLRGSTFQFYTGNCSVLPGLEAAVLTMHEKEEAQFVISYHLLFGEMGCPPRIKPHADALFIVELVKFNAVGDIDADKELSAEDRHKYAVVIEKVKQIHLKGIDFFKQGMYANASRAFEKAVNALNYCHLANEEEEREQTAFLIKLYTNLSVCYNKLNKPTKTCIMCREIRRLTQDQPSCKAIFQEGRALLMLGEFGQARGYLVRAQRMEPYNEAIRNEIHLLESRWKSYKENRNSIWRKAIGIIKESTDAADEAPSNFEETMTKILEEFKSKIDIDNFKLPSGLTEKEIITVDELCKQFEMQLEFEPLSKTHSIRKK